MADKDHGHAALGKAADDLVKAFDLLVGQGGGGFIHDDEPGVLQDRPRDGDDLLLRDRQRADFCIQVQSDADGVQRLLRLYAGFAPMHSLAAFHQLHPQRDVLGHREVGEDGEILIDHLYALLDGNDGVQRGEDRAVQGDAAGIRRVDTGDDLDERGLAASVFAHQTEHFAGKDLQVDIVQHAVAGE